MTDPDTRKSVLRMIPYGLFILTTQDKSGQIAAATVNWVTQTSFKPPLVSVAVRQDSFAHQAIQESGVFALNTLGKGHSSIAFAFFKPTVREGMTLSARHSTLARLDRPFLKAPWAMSSAAWLDRWRLATIRSSQAKW